MKTVLLIVFSVFQPRHSVLDIAVCKFVLIYEDTYHFNNDNCLFTAPIFHLSKIIGINEKLKSSFNFGSFRDKLPIKVIFVKFEIFFSQKSEIPEFSKSLIVTDILS